jgi:hypothetical protein
MRRNLFIIVPVLLLAMASVGKSALPLKCVQLVDSHIQFNMNDLQKDGNYDLEVPLQYKLLTPNPLQNYRLTFNFCTKADPPLIDCTASIYSMAYLYTNDNSTNEKRENKGEKKVGADLTKCMPLSNQNTSWDYLNAIEESSIKRLL